MNRRRTDVLLVFAAALAVRLLLVLWAGSRFPPADDGIYYDTFAHRLAQGFGYTWLWPDGVVTAASHYPVGYPLLLSLAYRISPTISAALTANALVGALAAPALMLALPGVSRRTSLLAGFLVAFDPALVPYTLVVMTEGVTTSLLVGALALGVAYRSEKKAGYLALAGVALGLATLVRPQCVMLAPLLGVVASDRGLRPTATAAALVTATALLVCAPWAARNCLHTDKCSLVSANGGWNLLIGVQTKSGAWEEIRVPDECKEVFQEGAKDTCFGAAARRQILADIPHWLSLVPRKLGQTFDFLSPAPGYLERSNGVAMSHSAAIFVSALETLVSRVVLILALLAACRAEGPRPRARWWIGIMGALGTVTLYSVVGYLALVAVLLLLGAELRRRPLYAWTAGLIAATAATHGVFFGAGRYGLVVLPFVAAMAALGRGRERGLLDEDRTDASGLAHLAG